MVIRNWRRRRRKMVIFDISQVLLLRTRLCALHFIGSNPCNPQNISEHEVGAIIITFSQRRNPRHREVKKCAPNHMARKWWNHNVIQFCLDQELMQVTTGTQCLSMRETLNCDVNCNNTFWNVNTILKSQQKQRVPIFLNFHQPWAILNFGILTWKIIMLNAMRSHN